MLSIYRFVVDMYVFHSQIKQYLTFNFPDNLDLEKSVQLYIAGKEYPGFEKTGKEIILRRFRETPFQIFEITRNYENDDLAKSVVRENINEINFVMSMVHKSYVENLIDSIDSPTKINDDCVKLLLENCIDVDSQKFFDNIVNEKKYDPTFVEKYHKVKHTIFTTYYNTVLEPIINLVHEKKFESMFEFENIEPVSIDFWRIRGLRAMSIEEVTKRLCVNNPKYETKNLTSVYKLCDNEIANRDATPVANLPNINDLIQNMTDVFISTYESIPFVYQFKRNDNASYDLLVNNFVFVNFSIDSTTMNWKTIFDFFTNIDDLDRLYNTESSSSTPELAKDTIDTIINDDSANIFDYWMKRIPDATGMKFAEKKPRVASLDLRGQPKTAVPSIPSPWSVSSDLYTTKEVPVPSLVTKFPELTVYEHPTSSSYTPKTTSKELLSTFNVKTENYDGPVSLDDYSEAT